MALHCTREKKCPFSGIHNRDTKRSKKEGKRNHKQHPTKNVKYFIHRTAELTSWSKLSTILFWKCIFKRSSFHGYIVFLTISLVIFDICGSVVCERGSEEFSPMNVLFFFSFHSPNNMRSKPKLNQNRANKNSNKNIKHNNNTIWSYSVSTIVRHVPRVCVHEHRTECWIESSIWCKIDIFDIFKLNFFCFLLFSSMPWKLIESVVSRLLIRLPFNLCIIYSKLGITVVNFQQQRE